jgi:hypothetical protein
LALISVLALINRLEIKQKHKNEENLFNLLHDT